MSPTRIPVLLLLLAALASSADAQPSPADVEILLTHSEYESVLGGVMGGIREDLSQLGVDSTAALQDALETGLGVEALAAILRERFAAQGDSSTFAAAARLVQEGAIARVESIVDSAGQSVGIEEYVQTIQAAPPPQPRVELVVRLAAAQKAGDFYVLVDERTREGAHVIGAAVSSQVPPYEPIGSAAWTEQARQSFLGALVSFLHRLEKVPDDELEAALSEWTSGPGAWYVDAYSLALGETIVDAAERVADEVR